MDLAWVPGSTNEFEFRIERSDDGGTIFNQVGVAPMFSTGYSDLGLLPNKSYSYRVTAWNSVGNSPYAGPAAASTAALTWKSTIGGPGIRADHSAIYDSLGRRMILFGGQDDFFTFFNEVWALDLLPSTTTLTNPPTNHWTQLSPVAAGPPSDIPKETIGHSAIYDVQNDRMVVFGGQDTTPAPNHLRNEVFVLTLGVTPTWSKVTPTGTSPTARMGHVAAYDAANQRMLVYGGIDAGGNLKSDAFFLSLPANLSFAWSSAPSGPSGRAEHSAMVDGLRQQAIVFGGVDNNLVPDGTTLNGETWSLSMTGAGGWTRRTFSGPPPSFREGHTTVYDADNQRLVLFGGDTTYGSAPTANNDLWALRLDVTSDWTFLSPSAGAPPVVRYGHTAIYDSGNRRMVVFGGYDSSPFPAYQDTWLSDF